MNRFYFIFFALFLLSSCVFQRNGYDKDGLRHGKYVVEWDRGMPMQKGRFRHGKETGKWKHFDIDGNLVKTEKYMGDQILTTHYRPDGSMESKGMAYLYFDDQFERYSWEGIWHYYSPKGAYDFSVNFVRGQAADTLTLQTQKFIYHERSAR